MSNMQLKDYHRITVYGTTESQATLKEVKDYVGGGSSGGVSIDDVTGVGATGLAVAKATTPDIARTAIGAGTSNLTLGTTSTTAMKGDTPLLQIGTTSTTAKAGDWTPPNSSDTVSGYMTSAQFTKLSGIATGATANQADAFLLDRANHTGTQAFTTLSGTATATQIPNLATSKITSGTFDIARIPTGVTATTVALGNHTHAVATTTANGFMSSADKTKLDGLSNTTITPTLAPTIAITDPPDDENIQASFDALILALKTAGVLT